MRIARSISELQSLRSGTIGFVPTMGYFHEGHLSLMRKAKSENDSCVVSLFVNPTQFGAGEDFEKYPRDEDRDFHMAEGAGVDLMFVPSVEEMYPRKTTAVHVHGVSELWEGEYRPGHYEGVATIVCKLFNIVQPNVAYFGLKDYQQCSVIQTMVEDLNCPLTLSFEETVRERDGLALSSRNKYLSPEERIIAPRLFAGLENLREMICANSASVDESIRKVTNDLSESGFRVQYLSVVDPQSLVPVKSISGPARILVAAYLGKTRLIDNIAV